MNKFGSVLVLFGILFSNSSSSAELFQINQANLSFDTFIRVEIPGKIIESDDPVHVGSALSFYQSLRYSGAKVIKLNRTFASLIELKQFVDSELCPEVHAMELNPIREGGAKGSKVMIQNMKPKTIFLIGTHVSNKGAPISNSYICR